MYMGRRLHSAGYGPSPHLDGDQERQLELPVGRERREQLVVRLDLGDHALGVCVGGLE